MSSLSCPICFKKCARIQFLTAHVLEKHLLFTPYLCCSTFCSENFSSEITFKIHCRLRHNNVKQCYVAPIDLSTKQVYSFCSLLNFLQVSNVHVELQSVLKWILFLNNCSKNVAVQNESSDDDIEIVAEINKTPKIVKFNQISPYFKNDITSSVGSKVEVIELDDGLDSAREISKNCNQSFNTFRNDSSFASSSISSSSYRSSNIDSQIYHNCTFKCLWCHQTFASRDILAGHFVLFHHKPAESLLINVDYVCNFTNYGGLNNELTAFLSAVPGALRSNVGFQSATQQYKQEQHTKEDTISQPIVKLEQNSSEINPVISSVSSASSTIPSTSVGPVKIECTEINVFKEPIKRSKNGMPLTRCQLCSRNVYNYPSHKRLHSVSHLKAENPNLAGCFRCLHCSKVTLRKNFLLYHINREHGKSPVIAEENVDFVDQSNLFDKEVERFTKSCFPQNSVSVKRKQKRSVTGGSSKRVQCHLCGVYVGENNSYVHATYMHLAEETGIEALYKCLICKFQSLTRDRMKVHCFRQHQKHAKICEEGVHFDSLVEKYKNEIYRCRLLAFPRKQWCQRGRKRKLASGSSTSLSKNKPIKCQLCAETVSRPDLHYVMHLPEKANIRFLYKCLLCADFTAFRSEHTLNHIAVAHKLKPDVVRINKHYLSLEDEQKDKLKQVFSMAFPSLDL